MPNPLIIAIPSGAAPTKVATDVQTGLVKVEKWAGTKGDIKYLETYRLTGEAAPTNQAGMIKWSTILEIDHLVGIDVYIGVVGDDDGIVRVDL